MVRPDLERVHNLQCASAEAVIDWALEEFRDKIAYACSFGAEGMVLIDLLARRFNPLRILTIDTGRLPQETHQLVERVRERYRVTVDVYVPETSAVQELVTLRGPNSFYRSVIERKECCRVRKVEPLDRALYGLDAWITGLRRDQTPARAGIRKIEHDGRRPGVVKIMPLADWSWTDVWTYIRRHDVPYSSLHDEGYRSIGCAPCSRAVGTGEDDRAGRWWWERDGSRECGLHLMAPHDSDNRTQAAG